MFKGCQRKIIMLKNTGSGIFDEAYFVIKESAAASMRVSENDMIAEANRILNENKLSEYCMKGVRRNRALKKLFFSLGIFASVCTVIGLIVLAVILI